MIKYFSQLNLTHDLSRNIYIFLILLIQFFNNCALACESKFAADELDSLSRVLKLNETPLAEDLEHELKKEGFHCQKLQNSCSGNDVFKLEKKYPYILKVLRTLEKSSANEVMMTENAGIKGLGPCVFLSGKTSNTYFMVMEFLESRPLSTLLTWLKIDWEIMTSIFATTKKLHNSNLTFPPATTLIDYGREHFTLIETCKIPTSREYQDFLKYFDYLASLLNNAESVKPCHFDLHEENIFINNKRLATFIDWDCAGMGDIYLELAALSLKFRLTNIQDSKMLDEYFGSSFSQTNKSYFFVAKSLCFGLLAVREFIRPYFSIFPPYSKVKEVQEDEVIIMESLSQTKHLRYDDLINLLREGGSSNITNDLEIGILLMQECLNRLNSDSFLEAKKIVAI
ncbi:hypothetical protein IM40_02510 [Candidatus Paracaedimonas acanthamoebae]|nr:hypothetical protein IM40_02510 [Candidatus Paracaedimonas acanthamoebae]